MDYYIGSQLMEQNQRRDPSGYMMNFVMIVVAVLFILLMGFATLVLNENWFSIQDRDNVGAMSIADAGVNYYLWHLAHYPDDYCDGDDTCEGPYIHDVLDWDGDVVGYFILDIDAPTDGSSIAHITSTGELANPYEPAKSVEAYLGVPSLTKFAFLTNADVWFGDSESVDGKLHSNGGIRMDGTCNDMLSSEKETYECQPDHGCASPYEDKDGIWGNSGADTCPDSFWDFPVSHVDFDQITQDISDLYDAADLLLPELSNRYGYRLVFGHDVNGDYVTISRVRTVYSTYAKTPGGNYEWYYDDINQTQNSSTYRIGAGETIPNNGIIYVEDKIWVEGQTGSRLTVVAALLGASSKDDPDKDIIIPNNITYTIKDGSAVLGLIAERDIRVPLYLPSYGATQMANMEIDAVLLAQNGRVARLNFSGTQGYPENALQRGTITTYGSLITNQVWTWTCVGSASPPPFLQGFATTNSSYDPYLYYGPPPMFPSSGEYEILSWQEVTNPY
jgi:hypothetical protein